MKTFKENVRKTIAVLSPSTDLYRRLKKLVATLSLDDSSILEIINADYFRQIKRNSEEKSLSIITPLPDSKLSQDSKDHH